MIGDHALRIFRLAFMPCDRIHFGDLSGGMEDSAGAYCPECGCMLETDHCWGCGLYFLHFGPSMIDDVIRDAAVDECGDVMCARCMEELEQDRLMDGDECEEAWLEA